MSSVEDIPAARSDRMKVRKVRYSSWLYGWNIYKYLGICFSSLFAECGCIHQHLVFWTQISQSSYQIRWYNTKQTNNTTSQTLWRNKSLNFYMEDSKQYGKAVPSEQKKSEIFQVIGTTLGIASLEHQDLRCVDR